MFYRHRCRATAKKLLNSEQGEDVDEGTPTRHRAQGRITDPALSRFASRARVHAQVVHMGKKKYATTTARLAFFGHRGQELTELFKNHSVRTRARVLPALRVPRSHLNLSVCTEGTQTEEATHDDEHGQLGSARRRRRRRAFLAAASVRPMLQRARVTRRT